MNRSHLLIFGSLSLLAVSAWMGCGVSGVGWPLGDVSTAVAADVSPPPTTHALFTKLLHAAGVENPNSEVTQSSIFQKSNKNLYLYMYQQTMDKPEQDAIQELAQSYGLTPTDAEIILNGGLTPLFIGRSAAYTQERAIRDMTKIQRSYAEILRHKRLGYELDATLAATEIFSNGDLSDSSFDLVHDLDIIEEILFVDQGEVKMNKKLALNPLGKSPFGTSSNPLTSAATGASSGGTKSAPDTNVAKPPSPPANTPQNTGKPLTIEDILAGAGGGNGTTGTVNACQQESPLNKALTNYTATNNSGSGGGGNTSGTSPLPIIVSSSTPPDISAIAPPESKRITTTPATPLSLTKQNFCADLKGEAIYTYPEGSSDPLFCVTLDMTTKTYNSFTPDKTCIQCTVAAMNETMKKLLSKSLAPNKLTGNVYESTKCSETLSLSDRLSMNIFLIPSPVITPQKLGPLVGHDLGVEWDRYVKKAIPFAKTPERTQQKIVNEALQNAAPDVTQDQLLGQINQAIAHEVAAAQRQISERETSTQTDAKSEGYQQIIQEMRLMTSFFSSFKQVFEKFNKDTCPKFENK